MYFFFNSKSQVAFMWLQFVFGTDTKFQVVQIIESPSAWSREYGRMNTSQNASAQFILAPNEKLSHRMKIDLIGEHIECGDPLYILKKFDQPCCRVGFSVVDGKKEWILDTSHKQKIKYPKRNHGKACERELTRRQKYIDRNYLNLECDCIEVSFCDYIFTTRKNVVVLYFVDLFLDFYFLKCVDNNINLILNLVCIVCY